MNSGDRIFVAGHHGLVGSAIVRRLEALGYDNLILRSRTKLDLVNQAAVAAFMREAKPEYVFLAAARVGGIHANSTYPADFIRDNLQIQTNVIDSAYRANVSKLLFLGSSCIYPRLAPQPMKEEHLLSGPLEATNEWYAIAKIAGIKMCQAYTQQHDFNAISLMPTNLYGPGDNFDLENSHVLPALIRKCHEAKIAGAKTVEIWGTGQPRREFLHVDDMADAAVYLMKNYDSPEIINVGTGTDVSIRELAELVQRVVGFEGDLKFDTSKPDGTPRKLLDVSRLVQAGWQANIGLQDGIARTYEWFLSHQEALRA
jgi:GDP-L-fucose synthase